MNSRSKDLALVLIVLFLMPLVTLQPVTVKAQPNNLQAPAIEWQQNYVSNRGIESASNIIQTSDGGYAFIDQGWGFQDTFVPATVYKVDSLGNVNWTKTINSFDGDAIIQTSDKGLEVSGDWVNFPLHEYTPTLVKMDSEGNIEWVKNYSNVPNLGVTPSSNGKIRTSDGGFVHWTEGSIVKTSSNNSTQWVENVTYPTIDSPSGIYPLGISSVIETSDGALAILGVGYNLLDNPRTGNIYLLKTEPFLPSPSQLPAPYFTASIIAVLLIVIAIVIIGVSILFYTRRHRKT